MNPLIGPHELAEVLDDVVLCDIRWDLTDESKGRATYEKGHIPGAVFVDLDRDLAGPEGLDGRHPLPDADVFTATLGRIGIGSDSHVVVYDDVYGRVAARLWWMLHSIGHESVQLLDGGYWAWTGETETGWNDPIPTQYPKVDGFTGVVDHDELDNRVIIDARAGARYRGEYEPLDPKAGHIPGAVNISTGRNLDADGYFLDEEDLADVYAEMPPVPVVSCGSGVNACHNALAMVVAGRSMPDIYVGSFSEWSRRDKPVDSGTGA